MNKNEKMVKGCEIPEKEMMKWHELKERIHSEKEWGKREISLAMEEENDEKIKNNYFVAQLLFNNILDTIGDKDNPGMIKTILIQLFNKNPLTPITDNEEDWTVVEGFGTVADADNPGYTVYQCKRRNTLFKQVTYDKKTGEENSCKYSDTGRAICIDINTEQNYIGGMGNVILDEMYPIAMPYSPNGKIKIFTEEFKYHKDSKVDSDTIGVLYFRLTNGQMVEVKRFFKDDPKTNQMVEINLTEYNARKKKAMNKED